MILDIQFKNYRSFKDKCNFSMEASSTETKANNVFVAPVSENDEERLLKIAIIYGVNASGKTNIIRMLYALRSMISNMTANQGGEGIYLYEPFVLDEDSKNEPTEISISFIVNNIKHLYELTYNGEEFLSEKLTYFPKGVAAILFERVPVENDSIIKVYEPKYFTSIPKSKVQKFAVFSNKLILSKFLYDIPFDLITPAAKYLANIHIANGYHSRMINQLWDEFRDWLAEDESRRNKLMKLLAFADLGIKAFKIDVKETSLQKVLLTHESYCGAQRVEDIDFSFDNESYGTRQLFILGGKILQSLESGSPLFVDEMDTGFHTYISSFILDIFRDKEINKKNAQLILTTHDINLLNEDKLRRDQIWFTEKSERGTSDLYSLSDFSGVREDTPFAKWYMANKFGAVPSIKPLQKLF
ncbi:AAA family ATPase [Butyricimonas virosa]|jgi:AAA15 family ATPase/GTPase|uniref:ATP-binding protein n=2 Tax=Butyricimonas virosa TaxID=544645 RepID=A0ABX7H9I1_9BACT|nr:ATP-binding protein [Butyricimonas virosa]MCI7295119.1 ATP-binding protein [Butyricimonas virosa]MDY6218763.1 ATP-binding protein [Butyricimonas virosa]QRO51737.1 ATP-binding protein [Butyricimonas virosa]RGL80704.1 ATP-binding protein [Butyricimonas virosa]UWO47493.1 ATP-binding protein [Butyricimonas virosa]